ncbi:hypothetical protein [Microbispora bryophytorum]|uniref:Uncharacterized protein n=1 Tax=Microbispora bryophytorum subsp. camponoti TaxID=1677852 RepID=A0ABR8L305_9ACTN|nr:hypothetical protein [Microbispora camponoti]MBD3142854.1 hypothetical protein [Microbispora camponoti]
MPYDDRSPLIGPAGAARRIHGAVIVFAAGGVLGAADPDATGPEAVAALGWPRLVDLGQYPGLGTSPRVWPSSGRGLPAGPERVLRVVGAGRGADARASLQTRPLLR